jgi:HK97 family phage major capsid protein
MAYTKRLLAQTNNPAIDNLLREDFNQGLAHAIDSTGLYNASGGTGPTGICNGTVPLVTFGGTGTTATWGKVVEMETTVAGNNGNVDNMAYIMHPATYGGLKTIAKTANTASFIVEPDGTVNGYKVAVTNNLPQVSAAAGYAMAFGNWRDMLIGMWGGLDITVDAITYAANGGIVLHSHALADITQRRVNSFSRALDVYCG